MIRVKTVNGTTIECETKADLEIVLNVLHDVSVLNTPIPALQKELVLSTNKDFPTSENNYYTVRHLAILYEEKELQAGRDFLDKDGRRLVECNLQGLGNALSSSYPEGRHLIKYGVATYPWDDKTRTIIKNWQSITKTNLNKRLKSFRMPRASKQSTSTNTEVINNG